jgi:hypothetical protein
MIGQGSPESNQNIKTKINKTYIANPKIQNNKIRPGGIKFSSKSKVAKDGVARATSGSSRHQHSKEGEEHMSST